MWAGERYRGSGQRVCRAYTSGPGGELSEEMDSPPRLGPPPPRDGMLCFLLPGWLLSLHGRHLPDGRSVGRRETGPSSDICTSGPFRPLQELPSKPHMRCSLSLDYPSRRLPPPPPSFPPANSNPLQNLFYFFVLSSLEGSPGPPSPSSLGFPSSPTWIPLF